MKCLTSLVSSLGVWLPARGAGAVLVLGLVLGFATPAQGQRCDVNLDTWTHQRWDRTLYAPHYSSKVTFRVRVSPPNCTWRFDTQGKPSWLNLVVVQGAHQGNGVYRGAATVDVFVSANAGFARSGRFKVVSSNAVPVDVTQSHGTGRCQFQFGGPGVTTLAPGFLVIKQPMTLPTTNFLAQFTDSGTCTRNPRPLAFTAGMTGATLRPTTTQLREFVLHRAGVRANLKGEGALFALSQPGYTTTSGILALSLPVTASLPPELQLRSYSLAKPVASHGPTGSVLPFGDMGGVIRINGTAVRTTPIANRPCLFTPAYHQVVGGSWLTVTSESGCDSNPDQGTLVIAVTPSAFPRVGAVYTPWGSALFVVQGVL